jgi:hypothetical protein
MGRSWFDPHSKILKLDEYVLENASFQKIMADTVVTDEEMEEQSQRTLALLQKLETMLSPEIREVATETLSELAVLYALQHHHQRVHR